MSSRRTRMKGSRHADDRRACLLPAALLPACASQAAAAAGSCVLARLAELPVTMAGTRPLVHAAINGTDALFLADSGMFYSSLTTAAASEFKLSLHPAPFGYEVRGIGGGARPYLTEVKTFTIFGLPVPHVQFLVLPNDLGNGEAGIPGQNEFRLNEGEYEPDNGGVLLRRPRALQKAPSAAWAKGPGHP